MKTVKVVQWQEGEVHLGYLDDYPDYWTQGNSKDDLQVHLADLYKELSGGTIPAIRKVEELVIA